MTVGSEESCSSFESSESGGVISASDASSDDCKFVTCHHLPPPGLSFDPPWCNATDYAGPCTIFCRGDAACDAQANSLIARTGNHGHTLLTCHGQQACSDMQFGCEHPERCGVSCLDHGDGGDESCMSLAHQANKVRSWHASQTLEPVRSQLAAPRF